MTSTTEPTRKRVVVVDDDASCCVALRMLLDGEGFDVDVAHSGEAALARMAECPPHVLLTDVRMPGMDGFALLREARRLYTFPVILMSADGKNEPEVLKAGAAAYVAEPRVAGSEHEVLGREPTIGFGVWSTLLRPDDDERARVVEDVEARIAEQRGVVLSLGIPTGLLEHQRLRALGPSRETRGVLDHGEDPRL